MSNNNLLKLNSFCLASLNNYFIKKKLQNFQKIQNFQKKNQNFQKIQNFQKKKKIKFEKKI